MKYALASLLIALSVPVLAGGGGMQNRGANPQCDLTVGEMQHLRFMREEEKLARDVYTTFSQMYPDSRTFGNIDNSEQEHTDAVKRMLEKYGKKDPCTNDNVGIFTGEEYAEYFTEKYELLISMGSVSELEAQYAGAFIEELDMLDILNCNKIILEKNPGLEVCGLEHTDKEDLQQLLTHLLEGSMEHLQAYVKNIETEIGYGNYQPQLLTQEQLDEYLGR